MPCGHRSVTRGGACGLLLCGAPAVQQMKRRWAPIHRAVVRVEGKRFCIATPEDDSSFRFQWQRHRSYKPLACKQTTIVRRDMVMTPERKMAPIDPPGTARTHKSGIPVLDSLHGMFS